MEYRITHLKKLILFIIMMTGTNLFAQNYVPFTSQTLPFADGLKGDMLLIGNNLLNRPTTSDPYNGTQNNNDFNMGYIDVDSDATTFNSSTADLVIPSGTNGCYEIQFARLYWAGMYSNGNIGAEVDRNALNQVKFKVPGGAYMDLTGTIIYDSFPTSISSSRYGYAAYIDVTAQLQALGTSAEGTYGVANVQSGLGTNTSAGWVLYVVYEDPLATAKNISLFHGFSVVGSTNNLDIPISGFTSIPVGPVRAKLAFSSLEGDRGYTGDRLRINGTAMTIPTRPADNFFNASINDINGAFNARNLNSDNLLGFDAGIINVPNPGNTIIANNATSATIRLETSGDAYAYYMNAFAIEVIQPQINLIKNVNDLSGTDISNQTVSLGQELFYVLNFQNIGNDGATNFTITDQLPINVTFLPADLIVPPGVTYTFDPITNTLVFTIPDSLVTQGGANYKIIIKVKVAETCEDIRDACSNEIRNQAYQTYSSLNSGNVVEDQQPSSSGISSCLILTPGTTNFIADIDDCVFVREEVLCGDSVTLTAGNGYDSYQWHSGSPPTAGNLIVGATNQSYTVNATGTYSVVNTSANCISIIETFNVVDFSGVVPNPVIPYADQVDICPNDGSELPKIFLCGQDDEQLIQTNILNAVSIIWEQLDETSCPPVANTSCPNINPSCTWNQVATGPNFNVVNAGQYRVTITFQNGCFRTYYFNVYKNLFTPTVAVTDEICTTPGTVTVNGVPAGYEYTLLDNLGNTVYPWQASNFFSPVAPGVYTVQIRQIGGGVGNCIFDVPNVVVVARDFTVDVTVVDALCNGGQGSIRVQVNNVDPQYTYQILLGATVVNTVGPTNLNDYTFNNLNQGTYTVNVTTTDGCTYTEDVTINEPPLLTVTAAITIPLTCVDGEVTAYPVGGTPPYTYMISGTPGFQAVPNFVITTAGTYTITVTDFNNCTATTDIIVDQIPPPVFTINTTDILCYGESTGQIEFVVTNTNGYTLQYSIDNGANFSSNPVFSNLPAGTYETIVQYSLGGSVCQTTAQTIILTEPSTAVTASMGVSELAGCGPNGEGKIRVTNPQGGVPGYEYSFDGGMTWVATNEAYVFPGTYNVCIRDTNLCVYCASVTLDPAPLDPTITIDDPDFNCDGTATTTVTVNNNGGSFAYTYLLDGVPNTPPDNNVFTNVPCGPHEITVQYENLNIPTYSNLLFEDFGQGINTTSPGINPAYCFERQVVATQCNGSIQINDGDYAVTRRINPRFGAWVDALDHTSNGTNPDGRFLCVNIGGVAGVGGILYSKQINDIIPNQPVQASIWAMNLLVIGNTQFNPNLTIQLVKDLGLPTEVIVASQDTGDIPKTETWQNYTMTLNPGNETSLAFVIRSNNTATSGNDVVIDDLNVFQEPVACIEEVMYPIDIDCNQAFSAQITSVTNASCNGASDGQITIAAQNFDPANGFYYSLTGGAPFTNSLTSPVTITGLVAGTYNVVIQYDLSSTPCPFTFTQDITEPNPLVADATLTSPATCISDGVITASATGGTPAYQYQLVNSATGAIIVAFQSNNVFTGITPGDYIVEVRDLLNCTDPIDVPINVPAPQNPTATIDVTSDLCYDGNNAATIVVNATGGVPPYTYSINGGSPQGSNTFSNLTPGNYTITVTDSYGCTVTLPTVTIAPQLTASAVIVKGLDCTASPDAQIDVTINGGNAPFTYQVSFNAGPLSAAVNVTGNTFSYTTPNAGTYQFTITDAIGCIVVSNTVTVQPLPVLNVPTVTQTASNLCNGDENAAISVTPSGGLPPYVINVHNDTTGTDYGTQTTGLAAGSYTITVTDANSCTETATIVLTEPDPISFDVNSTDILCTAAGTEPGTITISNVSGGTPPFVYYISNSTGTYNDSYNAVSNEDHTFDILNFGIYTLVAVDANGCLLAETAIDIASPPQSLSIDVSVVTADCTVGGSAVVCVNTAVVGGPYHFALYQDLSPANPPYPTYPGSSYSPADAGPTGLCYTFTGLLSGVTYSFIVYDESTNCYYFQSAPGPIPSPTSITSTVDPHNVTCTGADDGSVSFTIDGYSGTTVSYEIYVALSNQPFVPSTTGSATGTGSTITVNDFGMLPPGDYFILFTEVDGPNAGCTQASQIFTISESPVLLQINAQVTHNDNCNPNAGQITVTGTNGMPPYSYQVVTSGSTPPDESTWGGQSSNVFNLEGGTYDVYIMDANGCIQSVTGVFVPTDTDPNITLSLDPLTLCNTTEGNYTIVVVRDNTVGVGPFTYSVDNSAFTTYVEDASFSFTITGLNSGTHTVIIKDSNGCTETETITILPPLNFSMIPSLSAVLDCGVSDGIITVNAGGGSGDYSYSISPNPASISLTANVFSGVPAGTYTVTVTDNITNCSIDQNITLDTPLVPSFDVTITNVTCNLGTDGSIVVNLTGSNTDPIYTYAITAGPLTFAAQNSNVFSNLPAGNYTVEVTSGRNCTSTLNVTVDEATPVVVPAPTITEFGCNSGTNSVNNATIVVTGVTGGSGTYSNYEFLDAANNLLQFGPSNTYIEANYAGGTYTINVYDSNGCIGTTNAAILPYIAISDPTVTVTTPITCTNPEEITINIVTTGGVPTTLNYTVIGLSAGSTYNVTQTNNPNFTGLIIGNYQITVENPDTGCSVQMIHYVFNPNTFVVQATVLENVTCLGGNDGEVEFIFVDQNLVPTNDAGPFSYVIIDTVTNNTVATGSSPDAGPFTVSNLAAGVYQLQTTLTNSPYCPAVTNFTISQPAQALSISTSSTPISCDPAFDGSISAVGDHGWGGPYEYQLMLGATIQVDWSTLSTFTGLSAGTYTVNVRDIEGCVVSQNVILTDPTPITADISVSTTSLPCVGDTSAVITISNVVGGYGSGYLFTLNNLTDGTTSGPQTSNVFSNLGAGTYNVTIVDSFNCTFTTADVTITEPADNAQALLAQILDPTCTQGATLVLSATGGTPPYSYSTTPGGPYGNTFASSVTFTNVAPGTYSYYVVDANTCFESLAQIVIDPVIPVQVDVDLSNAVILCNGSTTTVTATATFGLGNYVYSLLPATAGVTQTSPGVFENVPAGTYTVHVVSGDCIGDSAPFTIVEPTPLTYTASSTNITCPNEPADGTISVIATGGTGTIQYSISSAPNETVNSGIFTNLDAGTYTVYVQDQNGCTLPPLVFTITAPPAFSLDALNITEELCLGDNTGSVQFSISGGTTTATVGYTASNGATTLTSLTGDFSFTNLAAGTYDFMVTDANGCIFDFSVTLDPGVDTQQDYTIVYNCENNIPGNVLTVVVNQDIALSEFTFAMDSDPAQTSNIFNNVTPGNHVITITHQDGCVQQLNVFVDTFSTPNLSLTQSGLNQFTMFTTGGNPPYNYVVVDPNNVSHDVGSTTLYQIYQTGNYVVTVTDANGCTDTETIFMTFYDIDIPDYFTPDGDGTNDGWSPLYLDNFPNAVTYVFDRYSRKIITLKPGQSWDGRYKGQELPSGDYWYVLKLNGESDTREFVGNFTLYR